MRKVVACENPRLLAGFVKKSFCMSVNGGDVWFEHLDGIYENEQLVLEKLETDAKTFSRPSMPSLIAINIDETEITEDIADTLVEKLTGAKMFTRVVFVGVNGSDKRKLKRKISATPHRFALDFNNDFQKAKEWLVSESV